MRPCWAAGLFGVAAAVLSVVDAAGSNYNTIIDHGPSSNRVDMVFLGDGYTSVELTQGLYTAQIDQFLEHMFSAGQDPFPRYERFFNVHRVDTASVQSGADVPKLGINKNTALGASYYGDGVTERLLTVNTVQAQAALDAALSGAGFNAEIKLVAVNDTRYGGSGGAFAVFAGGNSSAAEIALHELGHSFAHLADEYGGYYGPYSGAEPSEENVTKDPTGAKWQRWLGYNDPATGVVGAYEGGYYYDHGVYRPSPHSKMRTLGEPFDPIAREQWILMLYEYVDPLDAWLDNSELLMDPDTLWVDSIDESVIDVEWIVDQTLHLPITDEVLTLASLGLIPGEHVITAVARDNTPWVRIASPMLEQSVTWTLLIVPEPANLLVLLAGGLVVCARRR